MDLAQEILLKRQDILRLANRYGVRNVRLFVSRTRGQATPQSDVNLPVDMVPTPGAAGIWRLLHDLRELLHRPIEVVTDEGP
jgi:predicted nucleotidyltransferase